jgi:hypothetical protein
MDALQHKFNKRGALTDSSRLFQCSIVGFLMLFDHALDRNIVENLPKTSEYHTLPEPSDTPVPVTERMDKFKLIVKHTFHTFWYIIWVRIQTIFQQKGAYDARDQRIAF